VLESVDDLLPLRRRCRAGDHHSLIAEVRRDLVDRPLERAEDEHLLALRDDAVHELERVRDLRVRNLIAGLGEMAEQSYAVLSGCTAAGVLITRHGAAIAAE